MNNDRSIEGRIFNIEMMDDLKELVNIVEYGIFLGRAYQIEIINWYYRI